MAKKRMFLLPLALFLIIPSVIAQEGFTELFSGMPTYAWFDLFVYLCVFTAIIKAAVVKYFGQETTSVSVLYFVLSVMMALGLTIAELKSGFYLFKLWPLFLGMLLLGAFAWGYNWLKGLKGKIGFWDILIGLCVLIIILILFGALTESSFGISLPYGMTTITDQSKQYITLAFIIVALVALLWGFWKVGKAPPGITGAAPGEGFFSKWWTGRKARKEQERPRKEGIKKEMKAMKGRLKAHIVAKRKSDGSIINQGGKVLQGDTIIFDSLAEPPEINDPKTGYKPKWIFWHIMGITHPRKLDDTIELPTEHIDTGKHVVILKIKELRTGLTAKDKLKFVIVPFPPMFEEERKKRKLEEIKRKEKGGRRRVEEERRKEEEPEITTTGIPRKGERTIT